MGYTANMPQKFCDMFSEIAMDPKLSDTFKDALVSKLVYKKASGQVQVKIELPCLVNMELIYSLEKILTRFFNTSISIIPCFKLENSDTDFSDCCKEYIHQVICNKSKHYGFLMKDANFEINGDRLKIHLKTTCKTILQSGKCDKYLEKFFKTCFNKDITVEFVNPAIDDKMNAQYLVKKMKLRKKPFEKLCIIHQEIIIVIEKMLPRSLNHTTQSKKTAIQTWFMAESLTEQKL